MIAQVTYTDVWQPLPGPQSWLIQCPIFETLFGGARGGGKSDGVLGEFIYHAQMYGEEAIGLCVRRERTQLTELIERSKMLYLQLGAKFHEVDKMWRFPNGARLRFAYLENDDDAQNYQGHSYTRLYVEEMGTFPNIGPILKLMATLGRNPRVPSRFIATANPGGPGHLWIKQRYIDPAPLGMKVINDTYEDPFSGKQVNSQRIFIPSKVTDNKYTNTPRYIANLHLAGHDNPELIKAWLMGDWNVMLGAFFHEWDTHKHVIETFEPPKHWTRFMSMDWGSAKPFSIGWWCVVPDEFDVGLPVDFKSFSTKESVIIPRGAIIRYREWYGCKPNAPNTGLKLTAEDVARGIVSREKNEPKRLDNGRPRINYRIADPSMAKEDGGPSLFERFAGAPYHISFAKADNTRVGKRGNMGGWDQLRARLKGYDGRPMIYFMDSCRDSIRTLPALQHDPDNIEDVDTDGEDHAADDIRYACMSRPYSRPSNEESLKRLVRNQKSVEAGPYTNYNSQIILHDDLNTMPPPKDKINRARIS